MSISQLQLLKPVIYIIYNVLEGKLNFLRPQHVSCNSKLNISN